jgi:hypothetical protein
VWAILTHSFISRITFIWMLIAIITINKLQKHQIDVKVALLNGASMMRFTWNNSRGLLSMDKKRKFVNFLNHYMICNKHLNNGMENWSGYVVKWVQNQLSW